MADDLKSLEDLLAMVIHDLRTPLSVVHTTTTMLLNPKYQFSPEQVREQHERIRRNTDLLNRMLSELTDVTHLRAGRFAVDAAPLDLDEALRDAITTQQPAASAKGVTLTLESPPRALRVQADRARIGQAFTALLGHAIESSAAGDRIIARQRSEGGSTLIEIAQPGRALSPEEVASLFDPSLAATQRQKSAAGLGLYIARGIVQAHGGRLNCISTTDTGTVFSIALPPGA